MKLFLREIPTLSETEVEVRFRERDQEVDNLVRAISSSGDALAGHRTALIIECILRPAVFIYRHGSCCVQHAVRGHFYVSIYPADYRADKERGKGRYADSMSGFVE